MQFTTIAHIPDFAMETRPPTMPPTIMALATVILREAIEAVRESAALEDAAFEGALGSLQYSAPAPVEEHEMQSLPTKRGPQLDRRIIAPNQ